MILPLVGLFAFQLACATLTTSGGESPYRQDQWAPTGQASNRTLGLGPNARTDIWTEGKTGAERKSFAVKSDTYVELARSCNPAIVNIFTTQELRVGIGDPFGIVRVPVDAANIEATSLGTGFFISADGFLLTNAHVIAKADKIHVFLHDSSEAKEVRVIGIDPLTDLALLKAESDTPLPFLSLANSDDVEIGEIVTAIGNPFGLDYSITTGVISAKHRTISQGSRRGLYEDFLQTSAQINPGNSGGPLINLWGEVVGVNTAVIAEGQGIGFAIPGNMIKTLLPGLVRNGRIVRGYAGFGLINMTPSLAKKFGAPDTAGALVASLDPYGPAAKAGLLRGDVIREVNGAKIGSFKEAAGIVGLAGVGARMNLGILRRGKAMTISITTANQQF